MNARLQSGPSSRSFLLTNWITASSSGADVVQDSDGWLELPSFNDFTAFVEVSQISNPTGGYVLLYLETAPFPDEATFLAQPVAGPIVCAPSSAPYVAKTASGGRTPLCRYVRWRVHGTTVNPWSVTFRIRLVANRARYFAPTDLGGCLVWLRADLGVTFTGTAASAWADQSGTAHDASQATGANQPTFSATAMNGFPAIVGDGATRYMKTAAFTIGSAATLIAAVQPAGTMTSYARILEQQYNATYFLGLDTTQAHYKLIVDNAVAPYGAAHGGTVTNGANAIVTGVYSSPTGTLYVNGSAVGSDSFTAPGASSLPLWIMQAFSGNALWNGYLAEAIVFNRALTSAELARVHRYLGNRYGVPM